MNEATRTTAPPATYTNPWAIAALVAGCAQFVLLAPATILAIVAGHIARSEIRRSGGIQHGLGLATAGLVLGYAGLLMPVVFVTLLMTAG